MYDPFVSVNLLPSEERKIKNTNYNTLFISLINSITTLLIYEILLLRIKKQDP